MSPPDEEGRPLAGTPSDLAAAAKPLTLSASIVGPSASRGTADTRVAEVVAMLGVTEAEALQWIADTDAECAEADRLDDEREAAAEVYGWALTVSDPVEVAWETDEERAARAAREEAREAAFLALQAELAALVVDVPELTDAEREAEKARIVEAYRGEGTMSLEEWLATSDDPQRALDKVTRDHLSHGTEVPAHLVAMVEALVAEERVEVVAERNAPVDWATLWAQADEPVQWLAEPLVEAGTSVALYSPPKVGKSLLALDVCAGIATGRKVLGKPAQAPRRVLYLDAENTPRDLVERLTAMGYSPADLDDRFAYVSFPTLPPLDTEQGGREFVALLDKHRPDLVVLDTVSRFVAGDENDARTYADLYRLSLVKAKQRGIAVLRLDHAGKDVAKGQRGSSAKSADVDTVWRLELVSERDPAVRLTRDVTRNGHGEGKVLLARIAGPLRHVPTGKAVLASDDAVALEEMPPNVRRLVEALQKHGVPLHYGRDKAGRALTERGVKWSSGDLSVALKARSSLADPMGSDLSGDLSDPFGQVSS